MKYTTVERFEGKRDFRASEIVPSIAKTRGPGWELGESRFASWKAARTINNV